MQVLTFLPAAGQRPAAGWPANGRPAAQMTHGRHRSPKPLFSGFLRELVTFGPSKAGPRRSLGAQVTSDYQRDDKGPPVFEKRPAFERCGTPNMSKWVLSDYIIIVHFPCGKRADAGPRASPGAMPKNLQGGWGTAVRADTST